MKTLQDIELVILSKEGSKKAFEELYVRYEKILTRFCYRWLRCQTRSEDIAHDVFLQVFETYNTLDPEKSFYGYLQTIAKNRILNEFKKIDIHLLYAQKIIKTGDDATNQTENVILDNDYADLLNNMIESLSPKQKEVFIFSRIDGLTHKEIAQKMNISVATVKEHATLALKKMKKQLTKHTDLYF